MYDSRSFLLLEKVKISSLYFIKDSQQFFFLFHTIFLTNNLIQDFQFQFTSFILYCKLIDPDFNHNL